MSSYHASLAPESGDRSYLHAVLTALLAFLAYSLLHPSIGVNDIDGMAYIIGAKSIALGHGYRNLLGESLNHWPPGYSAILSLFPSPLRAAWAINAISLGAAAGLLFLLLRMSRWNWLTAAGITAMLSAGFFRLLASTAKADMPTYALFLLALLLYRSQNSYLHVAACVLAGALIPIKLIAVVFIPGAICAELLHSGFEWRPNMKRWGIASAIWAASLSVILAFNYFTIHRLADLSREAGPVPRFLESFLAMPFAFVRSFFWSWNGTMKTPLPLALFGVVMVLASVSLASLRINPAGKRFLLLSAVIIGGSIALFVVGPSSLEPRLLGYGLLVLLCGLTPLDRGQSWIVAYGILGVLIAILNASTANSLGANDPRYAEAVTTLAARSVIPAPVCSNGSILLELHSGIAAQQVNSAAGIEHCESFFWIGLPVYDPTTPLAPMEPPARGWAVAASVPRATLMLRCDDKRTYCE